MLKNQQPYYWPISRIVEEYELILKSECKLSSGQRRVVKAIYEQKLNKGLIPGQKEVFAAEMEAAILSAQGVVEKLRKELKMPGVPLSDFTLMMENPEPGQIANFMLSYKGDFLGWIIVTKENEIYNAKYYVKNPQKQTGASSFGPGPQKEDVKRGANDQGNNTESKA